MQSIKRLVHAKNNRVSSVKQTTSDNRQFVLYSVVPGCVRADAISAENL